MTQTRPEHNPSPTATGLRVVIVGGGIGGWTLFRALRQVGMRPRLYEQAPAINDIGAGIQLSPNATRILSRVGLGPHLAEIAVPLQTAWELRRWQNGQTLASQLLGEQCVTMFGAPYYVVHRADLLALLGADKNSDDVRLGIRCVAVAQDTDAAWVTCDDGSLEEADVVIGADGVHSIVQTAVTTPTPPTFARLAAYRTVIPAARAPALARRPVATSWLGPGRHLVHYPIRRGESVNLVAAVPAQQWEAESWSAPGDVGEFAREFTDWDPRVRALIDAADRVGRYAMFDREPLQRWVAGRIGLLGDAAHPMLPALAQGAAQTIEDAAVLVHCLQDTDPAHVPSALARYEHTRQGRATAIQQRSRRQPLDYHLPDGPAQQARDHALAARDRIAENAWIWGHDPLTTGHDLPPDSVAAT